MLVDAFRKSRPGQRSFSLIGGLAYSSSMNITFLLLASCLMISAPLRSAQPEPAPLTNAPKTVASLDPAAATRAWLETVPAGKRARSDAYFEGGYWLILWNFLLGAAISFLLLGSGLSARLRDFAERITRFRTLQVVLFAVAYVVIVAVLSFPLGVYSGYFREHAYGLATQTFGPWFREQLIGLAVEIVATAILMMVALCRLSARPADMVALGNGGRSSLPCRLDVDCAGFHRATSLIPTNRSPIRKSASQSWRWRARTKSQCGRFSRWTRRGKATG